MPALLPVVEPSPSASVTSSLISTTPSVGAARCRLQNLCVLWARSDEPLPSHPQRIGFDLLLIPLPPCSREMPPVLAEPYGLSLAFALWGRALFCQQVKQLQVPARVRLPPSPGAIRRPSAQHLTESNPKVLEKLIV